MRKHLLATLTALVLGLGLVPGAASTATAAGGLTTKLDVAPSYDGNTSLTMHTLEWSDALPEYRASVVEVESGRRIPLDSGWADSSLDSDLEGPYEVDTTEPLVAGVKYEVSLRVTTTGFWHCSIYDEDGCSWYNGESKDYRWRLTYNGGEMTGTPYRAPTKIALSKITKWRAHGWRITATLTADSKPYAGRKLTAQYRTRYGWVPEGTWKTNAKGRLTVIGAVRAKTKYRFVFAGTGVAKAATSKVFFKPRD